VPDVPILTPSECATLSAIVGRMSGGKWEYGPSKGARFGYIGNGANILFGVPFDNYSPEPVREETNAQADADAIGIVEVSNNVIRMLATIAGLRNGCECGHDAPHDVQGEGDITKFFCSVDGCSCLAPKRERELQLTRVWLTNKVARHEATIGKLRAQAEARSVEILDISRDVAELKRQLEERK
jgi:hypothetical protein